MSSLFKVPEPKLPPPERMPDPMDQEAARKKRELMQKSMSRGSRESTILSGTDGGGGKDYSGSKLGGPA